MTCRRPRCVGRFERANIPIGSLADRVRDVVQSYFRGRRIVIDDETEVLGMAQGGGFGSSIGRNSFQRPRGEAIPLLHQTMDIHAVADMLTDVS